MVAKAYVLIETNIGKSRSVVETIRQLEGIQSVHSVSGPYDIITVVEGNDLNAIGEMHRSIKVSTKAIFTILRYSIVISQ